MLDAGAYGGDDAVRDGGLLEWFSARVVVLDDETVNIPGNEL